MASIPAGYQLHITSWENDGDNYNTILVNGLTKEDVACYLEILSLFKSKSQGGFANTDRTDRDAVAEAVMAAVENHPDISKATKKEFTFDDPFYWSDHVHETMSDLLGQSEHCDFRVFDSFTVYYYETPVKDVTSKFRKAKGKK